MNSLARNTGQQLIHCPSVIKFTCSTEFPYSIQLLGPSRTKLGNANHGVNLTRPPFNCLRSSGGYQEFSIAAADSTIWKAASIEHVVVIRLKLHSENEIKCKMSVSPEVIVITIIEEENRLA